MWKKQSKKEEAKETVGKKKGQKREHEEKPQIYKLEAGFSKSFERVLKSFSSS